MQLSDFGRKFGTRTGIMDLMDDMGAALAGSGRTYMLGGGNPGRIPAANALWRRRMGEIMADGDAFERVAANYDGPQGYDRFREALAGLLSQTYGWNVATENVAVTNGSQTATFLVLNMLAGRDGNRRRNVLFPLLPEYIGYVDQTLDTADLTARRPRIDIIDEHEHKYRIDFDALDPGDETAAICVSRPTNPSGNVLTDEEIVRLDDVAAARGIPLIIDTAYGAPFPDIVFGEATPYWSENTILCMSLSKIGLPGLRTGVVVGPAEFIRALSSANAVLSLANGNLGQHLLEPLLRDGSLLSLCADTIRPFYRERGERARRWLADAFDASVPYSLHTLEGSIFLWLWLRDLPITTHELYGRLKERGVIVVPGEYFFFGDHGDWRHRHECLRINYSPEPETVREGLEILAAEVNGLYR